MEELKLFQSPIFGQIRTVAIDGQVMFAATDVAKCLGYANHRWSKDFIGPVFFRLLFPLFMGFYF